MLEEDLFELGAGRRPAAESPSLADQAHSPAASAAVSGFAGMSETIDQLIRKLWSEATDIQDQYMKAWKVGNRIADEKNLKPGFVQVYVRMHKGCLEISWKRHTRNTYARALVIAIHRLRLKSTANRGSGKSLGGLRIG